jgi:hypothetical protein
MGKRTVGENIEFILPILYVFFSLISNPTESFIAYGQRSRTITRSS